MSVFTIIYLAWDLFIFIYDVVIRVYIRFVVKQDIEKIQTGKQIVSVPEIADLKEIRHSENKKVKFLYYAIILFRVLFCAGILAFPVVSKFVKK